MKSTLRGLKLAAVTLTAYLGLLLSQTDVLAQTNSPDVPAKPEAPQADQKAQPTKIKPVKKPTKADLEASKVDKGPGGHPMGNSRWMPKNSPLMKPGSAKAGQQERVLRLFDKDGDGKLSDEEKQTFRQWVQAKKQARSKKGDKHMDPHAMRDKIMARQKAWAEGRTLPDDGLPGANGPLDGLGLVDRKEVNPKRGWRQGRAGAAAKDFQTKHSKMNVTAEKLKASKADGSKVEAPSDVGSASHHRKSRSEPSIKYKDPNLEHKG